MYLSGAGPTIVAIVHKDNGDFEEQMKQILSERMPDWKLTMLSADNTGAVIL